jgi:predicted nuclease with TOPRIM domain
MFEIKLGNHPATSGSVDCESRQFYSSLISEGTFSESHLHQILDCLVDALEIIERPNGTYAENTKIIELLKGSLAQQEWKINQLEADYMNLKKDFDSLLETLRVIEERSAWSYESLKHQLKFGLDESQAVYRREARSRAAHKECFELAHAQLEKFSKEGERL